MSKAVVLFGACIEVSMLDEDMLISDIDSYSSMERGKITYLFDDYSKQYIGIGEVLEVYDDLYGDWDFKSEKEHYQMIDEIKDFCYNKYGIKVNPKIMIVEIN